MSYNEVMLIYTFILMKSFYDCNTSFKYKPGIDMWCIINTPDCALNVELIGSHETKSWAE